MEVLLAACCAAAVRPVWSNNNMDWTHDVLGNETLMYIAAGYSGVVAMRPEDVPQLYWNEPAVLGVCNTPGKAHGLSMSGSLVYVADWTGLTICDMENPTTPVVVGTTGDMCSGCSLVEVEGTVAYLSNDEQLFAIDVADVRDLTVLGVYAVHGGVVADFSVFESVVYVSTSGSSPSSSVLIVDFTNPASPAKVASYGEGDSEGVLAADGVLYVGFSSTLAVVDVGDPTWPTTLCTFEAVFNATGFERISGPDEIHLSLLDFTLVGTSLYSTGAVFDVSNLTSPSIIEEYTEVGLVRDLSRSYENPAKVSYTPAAVLFTIRGGVDAAMILPKGAPAAKGEEPRYGMESKRGGFPGSFSGVVTSGTVAVVSDHLLSPISKTRLGGLRFYNVSDPLAPTLMVHFSTYATWGRLGITSKPFIYGGQVYVAAGKSITSLDVDHPRNSHFAWWDPVDVLTDTASALWVEGDALYAAANTAGLRVFNVSRGTEHLRSIGGVKTSGNALDVAVAKGVAFVAADTGGLQMFDITKGSPTLLGTYDTPGHARGVAVSPSGGVVYVADDEGGLQVVDVSDPSAPTLLGSYALEAARSVQLDGDILYVADGSVGARIFDVSDPTSPVLLHTLVTDGNAKDVCVVGSAVYVADNGLRVFSSPETPVPTPLPTPVPTPAPTTDPTPTPTTVPTTPPTVPTVETPVPVVPLTTQAPPAPTQRLPVPMGETPVPDGHTDEGVPVYVWVLVSVAVAGVAVAAVAVYLIKSQGQNIYFDDSIAALEELEGPAQGELQEVGRSTV